jgi:hypothetical protein
MCCFFQSGIEPQNTESAGGGNVEVLKDKNTSYLYIPCSIFDIQKNC